ncbi:helix-turn-helix domain-containing protein [Pandoraea sp. SD6-2]|uniref:helix-turn-helix domain-containing protein n=1 Tax=Pandoraea sp. SD6-2 TaxID=1286093 RepID=UPI00032F3A7D|nr:helix-turn-helix domain-containing protein [Pandoraea sp. SD6-2]EON13129.1 hypothetical protein C266_13994 [Pandoraea sp. SD6-2]
MDINTYLHENRLTQTWLAGKLGVTPGAVWQWIRSGRFPPEHCPTIERLTDGSVRCEDLNDRVDWAYIRSHPEAEDPPRSPRSRPPAQRGGEGATADGDTAGAIA